MDSSCEHQKASRDVSRKELKEINHAWSKLHKQTVEEYEDLKKRYRNLSKDYTSALEENKNLKQQLLNNSAQQVTDVDEYEKKM